MFEIITKSLAVVLILGLTWYNTRLEKKMEKSSNSGADCNMQVYVLGGFFTANELHARILAVINEGAGRHSGETATSRMALPIKKQYFDEMFDGVVDENSVCQVIRRVIESSNEKCPLCGREAVVEKVILAMEDSDRFVLAIKDTFERKEEEELHGAN
jgi:hypothetical protein